MLLQYVQPDGARLRMLLDDHLGPGPRILRLADRTDPLPNLRHPSAVQGLLRWLRTSYRYRLRGYSSTPRLCRERRRRDSHVLIKQPVSTPLPSSDNPWCARPPPISLLLHGLGWARHRIESFCCLAATLQNALKCF